MWILSDGLHYDLVGIGVAQVDKIRIVREAGGVYRMESIPLSAKSIMVRALKTGATQSDLYTTLDPGYLQPEWQEEPHGSEIAVSVHVDGKPELVINIEHPPSHAFTYSDKRIVELLAFDVGHMLELLRSRERLKEMEKSRMHDILDSANRTVWMVSKDMSAPLRAIEEASYLLRQDPSKAEEAADIIDRDVRRALDVLLNITAIVSDTGVGMIPAVVENLFKPFFTIRRRDSVWVSPSASGLWSLMVGRLPCRVSRGRARPSQ